MTTLETVHQRLAIPSGAKDTTLTINFAIAGAGVAWPWIRVNQYVPTAGTLADGTFEYALAQTDITSEGVARVFVTHSSTEPEIMKRGWRERIDGAVHTLVFEPWLAKLHTGKAFNIAYQSKPTAPSLLTDTLDVNIPLEFWDAYILYRYMLYSLTVPLTGNTRADASLLKYEDSWKNILKENAVRPMNKIGGAFLDRGR